MNKTKFETLWLLELLKLRIAALASVSAASGYALAAGGFDWQALTVFFGVILLSGGSLALNQIQDIKYDVLMERTRRRPLPSGRITAGTAWLVSIVCIAAGTFVLVRFAGALSASVGLGCIVLYNGIYTYLKRVTPFAIIPGAVVGALAPVIGWTAYSVNGELSKITAFAIFCFIWQLPHFWILLMLYSEDYKNAGLPSFAEWFSKANFGRIIFVWIIAIGVTALLLPLFGMLQTTFAVTSIAVTMLWLTVSSMKMGKQWTGDRQLYRIAFRNMNIGALVVFLLIFIS